MGVEEVTRLRLISPLLLAALLLAGCLGDATVDATPVLDSLERDFDTLARVHWEAASPGCEDQPIASLTLVTCENEPSLGALVDPEGKVICVDAMQTLLDELAAADPLAADPSPQPSHPGTPNGYAAAQMPLESAPPAMMATSGTLRDPTPTPVVEADDPTPTPVTNPDLLIPFVRFQLPPEPEEDDPTPTPTMEQ